MQLPVKYAVPFRILAAAVGAALPQLMVALPGYGWLWSLLGVLAGGTAFTKADK